MATEQNKAVDYQEQLLEAIRIVVEKQVKSVSFDKTIEAVIADASRASDGVYVVSTGEAKFDAYSTETNYKNNDAVMVTIPQGDYSKQKIIVGKQVGNSKTPLIYKSPFQQFINVSGNLIQSSGNYFASYYANKDDGRLGRCWPIDVNFEQSSCATEIYTYEDDENITVEIPCGQIWDSGNMQEQGYARLGLSAEFSTWLNEYDIINGNYGLVLKVTFKCVDLEDQQNNTFDKYLIFDSDEFFGDGLNFETYYLQEKLFDIEEYAQYQIVHMTLYSYQRSNFTTLDGAYGLGIYGEEVLPNDEEDFSIIQPNIFVKSPMICLGTPLEDFDTDTAEIICDGKLTYYKTKDDPSADRDADNKKELSLRWIHKDAKVDIIAVVDPDTLPQDYEVRWYRYTLGSPSPDQFAGAHWKRFYGCADSVNEDNGEWAIEEINSPEEDLATNTLKELIFQPNVNKQEEKIKAIILKNENPNGNAIFRLVAVSNIITFTNDNEVRNKQTIIDTNALSIRYDDDEKGHYFLYNEAGDVGKKEDTEVRILTAVFDENVNDVYEKAVLQVAECSEIIWTFPDINANTMIIPMTGPDEDSQPATWDENGYWIDGNGVRLGQGSKQVGFTIKSHLDNNATQNTIQLDIVKDGLNYTAQIQPIFGTAGDNGSNYKLILTWQDGKNALNLSDDFDHSLVGDVILYDQAGDAVDWPTDAELEANWLVAEFGSTEIRKKEVETADYYYPVFISYEDMLYATYNNGEEIINSDNPDNGYQKNDYYCFIDTENKDSAENPNHIYYYYDYNNRKFTNEKPHDENSNPQYYSYSDLTRINSENYIQLYRKKLNNAEAKNKLEYKKVSFSANVLNTETEETIYGDGIDENVAIKVDDSEKLYYYSKYKKYFIKINDQYILDPWQDYQEVETYYEPIEAKEKVYTLNGVGQQINGLTALISNNNKITITANESVSMDSLFILQLTLKNFGDYDLVSYYPIALKDGETKDDENNQNTKVIQYIEGPDRVRYSSAGETDFNKNPYQITVLKYENGNMVKYRHGYNDLPTYQLITSQEDFDNIEEIYNNEYILQNPKPETFSANTYYKLNEPPYDLQGYWKLLFIEKDENNNEDNFKPVLKETAIDIDSNPRQIKAVSDGKYDIPLLSPISVYIPDALPYGVQFIDTSGSSEQVIWTQPILVYENKYPSATLNKWNGKDIETDQDAGTITASGFAAGKKERDNTFTGVVIGDWSRSVADTAITKNTGVYGFNHGAMAYAFKDDGTGFIGKDGKGRIFLDGDKSQIFSSNWANRDTPQGMLLDIDDGFIKMQSVDEQNNVYTRVTTNVKDRFFSWVDGYHIKTLRQKDNPDNNPPNPTPENYDPDAPANLYLCVYNGNEASWEEISRSDKIYPGDIVSFSQDISNSFTLSLNKDSNSYILNWFAENVQNTFNYDVYANRLYTDSNGQSPVQQNATYNSSSTYYLKESGTRYITLGANQPNTPLSIGTEKNVAQRRFRVDWDGTLHVIDGDFKGDISGSTISGSAVYASYLEAYRGNIGGWTIEYNELSSGNTVLNAATGISTNQININADNRNSIVGFCGYYTGNNGRPVLGFKSTEHSIALEALANNSGGATDCSIRLTAKGNLIFECITGGQIKLGVEGNTSQSLVCYIPANNQSGIYARFAPDPPAPQSGE